MAEAVQRRTFTAAELVTSAKRNGYRATKRLVADWVAIGLLDRGVPRGKGRGQGKEYRWSEHQRQLLLVLLAKHGTVKRPVLCNIPVSIWLIWGEDLVPLRQARRALATWAGRWGSVSWANAQTAAKQVLTKLDHPEADPADREHLQDTIAQAAYTGEVDEPDLAKAARRVFDPNNSGLTRGSLGIIDSNHYVKTLVARVTAIAQLEALPDDVYLHARNDYLTIGPIADQARASLDISGTPVSPRKLGATTSPDFEQVVNRGCLDLLTLIGLNLTEPRPKPPGSPRWTPPTQHGLRRARITK